MKNQRELFDLPDEVAYFNCAYTAPLLKSAQAAGRRAIADKAVPWTITADDFFTTLERARGLFGRLVGATVDDVAIIPAASYGVALAARNVTVEQGQKIIVLAEQFPSHVYAWRKLARKTGAVINTVARPTHGGWTRAVLAETDENTAVVAIPNCHWTDGSLVDLEAVGEKCRAVVAALVVDGTQSLGAMPLDVKKVQPDILVTTAHKWLLGPYSFGFCYVAPHRQDGEPLEENWFNREGAQDFSRLVDYRDQYQPGARRFDVGEASNFILASIAIAAMEQIMAWGVENISAALGEKTVLIAQSAQQLGLTSPPKEQRAAHMLGLSRPGGLPADLLPRLARRNIYVSARGEAIRVSPHLYNTDE